MKNKYDIVIGLDPGVQTGVAIWSVKEQKLLNVVTKKIHEAGKMVESLKSKNILVRFEDARLRKWFGNSGREKLQGAGSVKRDCKIWEDLLTDLGIPFDKVPPKSVRTKVNFINFGQMTGWTGRTSEHARDAAMLVFGYK